MSLRVTLRTDQSQKTQCFTQAQALHPSSKGTELASQHKDITIISAEPGGKGDHHPLLRRNDDSLFQTHFLYEVRDQNDNVALTDLSDDELTKDFDG